MPSKRFFRPKKNNANAQAKPSSLNSAAMKISVEELGLSPRTLELLQKNNIKNAAELCIRTEREMYKIQSLNKKVLLEISKSLKKHNLEFRNEQAASTNAPQKAAKEKPAPKIVEKQIVAAKVELENDEISKYLNKQDFLSTKSTEKAKQPVAPATQKRQIEVAVTKPLLPSDWRKVQRGGKWGFSDGIKTVINPMYDEVFSFKEGLACIEIDEKYGFIDSQNNVVIPVEYETALSFSEGLAVAVMNGKCGYIDRENNIIYPFVYDAATPFENGVARVKQAGKWGFLSKEDGSIRWK